MDKLGKPVDRDEWDMTRRPTMLTITNRTMR